MSSEQARSNSVFFRSRVALAFGFGGLLAIMGLAGIDALRVLQQFRRSDDQIRRRYLSENHVLNDIRSDVYVSGTYVRDYLLEPEPQRADVFRGNLEQGRKHMQAALDFPNACCGRLHDRNAQILFERRDDAERIQR